MKGEITHTHTHRKNCYITAYVLKKKKEMEG